VASTLREGQPLLLKTVLSPQGISKEIVVNPQNSLETENNVDIYLQTEEGVPTLYEMLRPKPRLIIFGGGHIAQPLAEIANFLQFEIIVYDDRLSFTGRDRFPKVHTLICESFDQLASKIAIRATDFVVIITRGHRHDQDCLREVLKGIKPYYIGLIGSKRRTGIIRHQIVKEGFDSSLLESLFSPIGLSIGAKTPEEIAVSILAEIIPVTRLGYNKDNSKKKMENYADLNIWEWLVTSHDPAALVTVVATSGSTPRAAGAKMAAFFDGRSLGSIGGGCAEASIFQEAREVIDDGGFRFKTIDLTDSAEEDGMVCGGTMNVLIESLN
jgi:xanthine dehydrogenase accessory factor